MVKRVHGKKGEKMRGVRWKDEDRIRRRYEGRGKMKKIRRRCGRRREIDGENGVQEEERKAGGGGRVKG